MFNRLVAGLAMVGAVALAGGVGNGRASAWVAPPTDLRFASIGAGLVAGQAEPPTPYVLWSTGVPTSPVHAKYCKFGEYRAPSDWTGTPVAWFKASHPDWIEYRADKTTPAYYSNGNNSYVDTSSVPLDLTNPAVIQFVAKQCMDPVIASRGNAVGVDHTTPLNYYGRVGHYDTSGHWVAQYSGAVADPAFRTSAISSFAAFTSAMRAIASSSGIAGFKVIANDIVDLTVEPTWWADLLPSIDVVFDEHGFTKNRGTLMRVSTQPIVGNKVANPWAAVMADYQAVEAQHKGLIINALETYAIDASAQPNKSDVDWALANDLLVEDARTASSFLMSGLSVPGQAFYYNVAVPSAPEYYAAIGTARGRMAAVGQAYTRAFTNGLVYVNPTTSTVVVSVAGTHHDSRGLAVSGSVTIPPTSGLILLNS